MTEMTALHAEVGHPYLVDPLCPAEVDLQTGETIAEMSMVMGRTGLGQGVAETVGGECLFHGTCRI